MIVLVSTFCFLVTVASAKDTDCCRLSVGFNACRNACNKLNALTDVRKKAQQLLELPLNCPAHLVTFWSCLNSSIPIFNGLSQSVNVTTFPASCCLLVVSGQSCRDACFSGKMAKIEKNCREGRMFRCIKRYEASQKCCVKATPACINACHVVFASDHVPKESQKQNVLTSCRRQKGGNYVKRCVKNMTDSPSVTGNSQMKCCSKAHQLKCQSRCNKEVLSPNTGRTPSDIMLNLIKDCGRPFDNEKEFKFWTCFMTDHSTDPPTHPLKGVDGAKLQCCSKARSTKCWQLCVKMHSSKTGRMQSWENFDMECTYAANEAPMMRCLSDVTEPCQLGCSGLSFCTNFNNRHTDLFRSCNAKSDLRAKHQLQEWKKGFIHMPSRVIAVQNIRKCLPETWKAIACVLQIKPCSSRTHKSTICRSDCIKILKQCGNSSISHKQNPFEICDELSPSEDQSGCLSISDYLRPSDFVGNVKEVTHPCQPSPCNQKNICDIDRDCYEATPTLSGCQQHSCKPGCPLGDASKFYVRMGEYARVPLVDGKEGYFQACYCDNFGKLAKCKNLEYVQTKACFVDGRYRDDNTQFHVDCNFCTCFDGERICTRRHCSIPLVASSSSTGRPKRYQFVYGNSSQDLKNLHEGMPCGCKPDHIPVCGSDGITYPNPCIARCAGLSNTQSKQGGCASLDPCNPSPCRTGERCVVERKVCLSVDEPCNQYYCEREGNFCEDIQIEPVCDQDNRQHPNLCSLQFNKKQLAYKGFCKDECKPPTKPVCGLNGETYSSKCAANSVRVLVDYEGRCRAIGYRKVEEVKPGNDQLLDCAGVKCPNITPAECNGIIPPGGCCPLCAAQLRILFSTRQLKINSDGVTSKGPITLHQLLSSLRRHVTTSECDLFGYVSMDGDIVVHIVVVTKHPTLLQIKACNTEAQKIEVFINTGSPAFGSDIALSTLKGAKSELPSLAAKDGGAIHRSSSALLLVFSLLKVYFTLKYILTNR